MLEGGGGIPQAEFGDCFRMSRSNPFVLQIALSAGIGGLLFGYDTGVISGALIYIRDDFKSVDRSTLLQETIVSMAVAGAIIGAALGGWWSDSLGRRITILIADVLFFGGAIVMAIAPSPYFIIAGRVFVGLGVGMASMTAPLYISEASPAKIRGALVSLNGLLITGGQFIAYLVNLAFSNTHLTWRLMLGAATVPAFLQFGLMWISPESPRWLYRKGRTEEAEAILKKLYPNDQVDAEVEALKLSVDAEEAETNLSEEGLIGTGRMRKIWMRMKEAWCNSVVRRGLVAGIGCQVAQQLVGINTVMYYSPTIVQLAGFASNSLALALSLITSGLNAIGSIVSMFFVDRYGRRKFLLWSMAGIIMFLFLLTGVFEYAKVHSPLVTTYETSQFGGNNTCIDFKKVLNTNTGNWNCMSCLAASSKCGFCAHAGNKLKDGACLAVDTGSKSVCHGEHREWYIRGCPSNVGFLAIMFLSAYILVYSPGMGTVPWIVNSEIYPLRYRGICGGMAAVANWCTNLAVSQAFLTLTEKLGPGKTFMLFGIISMGSFVYLFMFVPETKGLPFEEVEKKLAKTWKGWKTFSDESVMDVKNKKPTK